MSSALTWIPFYMEFADKLREYKERRNDLIEIIKTVYETAGLSFPIPEKDGNGLDIDPFTVFGLFNQEITDAHRIAIAVGFQRALDISAEAPSDLNGIPILNKSSAVFYGFAGDRQEHDIDNLWNMFVAALNFADDTTDISQTEFCKWFDTVRNQFGVKWNLTTGLFWVRPYAYLNLDSRNLNYLKNNDSFPEDFRRDYRKKAKSVPNAVDYLSLCNRLLKEIPRHQEKFDSFPSFSHYVWLSSKNGGEENGNPTWTPSTAVYSPGLSVQDWLELLNDREVFQDNSITVIQRIYEMGGIATCKELSIHYGRDPGYYNINSSSLANRIHKKTGCPLHKGKSGSVWWWPVLYYGRKADKYTPGVYMWKLREELKKAFEIHLASKNELPTTESDEKNDTDASPFEKYTKEQFLSDVFMTESEYDKLRSLLLRKKNIILQGAPGVGKTYSAKRLAYSIMGEKNEGRLCMVQFHQSYSYEDFVYGYRPSEGGAFEPRSGVFFDFCERSKAELDHKYFFIIDEINRGNLSKIFGELLMLIETDKRGEENRINLVYGGEPFYIPENLYIIGLMNTADRSLAMIDYALRRRFSFYTMRSAFEDSDRNGFAEYASKVGCKLYHQAVNKVMELNRAICKDSSLGKGFEIGHSYFTPIDTNSIDAQWVCGVIEYEIIPLIEEYWFDDDETVQKWITEFRLIMGEEHDN